MRWFSWPVRRTAALIALVAGIAASACGQTYSDLVTGTFDRGKLIALNPWTGSNSVGWQIDGYADVPDGTPATFTVTGPQRWSCDRVFHRPSEPPSTGGWFESDQEKLRDRVIVLPSASIGIDGPRGDWTITIDMPRYGAHFGHTWLIGRGDSANALSSPINPYCSQVALSLAQQQSFVDEYLRELGDDLNGIGMRSQPVRAQLQAQLDQAAQAKRTGDAQTNPAVRTSDYMSAATSLNALGNLVAETPGIDDEDVLLLTHYAAHAAALLLQTGLS